jgi:HTH-type transcriptional regulator/antitoxin HipB
MVDAQSLGTAVRRRRKQLGLTQTDLAESAGVSPPTVGDLELGTGSTKFGTVLTILRVLGLNLDLHVKGQK